MPGTVGRVPTPATPAPGRPPPVVRRGRRRARPRLGRHRAGPAGRAGIRRSGPWSTLVLASPMPMALRLRRRPRAALQRRVRRADRRPAPGRAGPARRPRCSPRSGRCPGVGEVIERVYRQGEPFLEKEAALPLVRPARPGVRAGRLHPGPLAGARQRRPDRRRADRRGRDHPGDPAVAEPQRARRGAGRHAHPRRRGPGGAALLRCTSFDADQVVVRGRRGRRRGGMVRRIRGEMLDEADERLPPLWRRLSAGLGRPPVVRRRAAGVPSFTARRPAAARTSRSDRHDQKIRALAALPLRTSVLRGGADRRLPGAARLVGRRAGAAGRLGRAGRPGRRAGPPVRDPARHRPAAAAQHAAGAPAGAAPVADRRPLRPGRRRQRGRRRLLRRVPAARPARSAWCSATWPGTTCRPPRGWARSGPRCGRWRWPTRRPDAVLAGLDRLVGQPRRRGAARRSSS